MGKQAKSEGDRDQGAARLLLPLQDHQRLGQEEGKGKEDHGEVSGKDNPRRYRETEVGEGA